MYVVSALQDRCDVLLYLIEFENNPFDNQRRDAELCNVVLDTPRYNGHTTAADNLWAGVPIVTFGNSIEMGGR